jgi:hypothetical protein
MTNVQDKIDSAYANARLGHADLATHLLDWAREDSEASGVYLAEYPKMRAEVEGLAAMAPKPAKIQPGPQYHYPNQEKPKGPLPENSGMAPKRPSYSERIRFLADEIRKIVNR